MTHYNRPNLPVGTNKVTWSWTWIWSSSIKMSEQRDFSRAQHRTTATPTGRISFNIWGFCERNLFSCCRASVAESFALPFLPRLQHGSCLQLYFGVLVSLWRYIWIDSRRLDTVTYLDVMFTTTGSRGLCKYREFAVKTTASLNGLLA